MDVCIYTQTGRHTRPNDHTLAFVITYRQTTRANLCNLDWWTDQATVRGDEIAKVLAVIQLVYQCHISRLSPLLLGLALYISIPPSLSIELFLSHSHYIARYH